jgi:hypothetical protein
VRDKVPAQSSARAPLSSAVRCRMRALALLFCLSPFAALAQSEVPSIHGVWETRDRNLANAPRIEVSRERIALPECSTTTYTILSDDVETGHWVLKGNVRVVVIEFDRASCPGIANRLSFQIPFDSTDQDFIVVSRYQFESNGKMKFGASSLYRRVKGVPSIPDASLERTLPLMRPVAS